MIYTVTFNPSLDYIISMDSFELGMTNRTTQEKILPGGKGLNVSVVLSNLGFETTALGFLAGFTGEEIKRRMEQYGCKTDFIEIEDGNSRINIKMKDFDGTEINGMGPHITEDKIQALMEKLNKMKKGDVLILAGSIPTSMKDSIYEEIMRELMDKEILVIVDATKDLLTNVLKYHPFLIKPNRHELGEIFGKTIQTKDEIIECAKKLQDMGARNVLVSMSSEGALLVAENQEIIESKPPKGILVNAVGSGDSMVAGFLAGWLEKKEYAHAFYMGVSAGSASAFSENLATREEVMSLYKQILGGR